MSEWRYDTDGAIYRLTDSRGEYLTAAEANSLTARAALADEMAALFKTGNTMTSDDIADWLTRYDALSKPEQGI